MKRYKKVRLTIYDDWQSDYIQFDGLFDTMKDAKAYFERFRIRKNNGRLDAGYEVIPYLTDRMCECQEKPRKKSRPVKLFAEGWAP